MRASMDTGFPQADVENAFLRVRRRQFVSALLRRMRRQPATVDAMLDLAEVTAALGWHGERRLGLQSIRVDSIQGTVSSRRDFDRCFRPTSNRVRFRWEGLALAERRGVSIPPIDVYRVGGVHFVTDGHHRVSIARASGREMVDAYVTEVVTGVPSSRMSDDHLMQPAHCRLG
jgi:hypothetical protein